MGTISKKETGFKFFICSLCKEEFKTKTMFIKHFQKWHLEDFYDVRIKWI